MVQCLCAFTTELPALSQICMKVPDSKEDIQSHEKNLLQPQSYFLMLSLLLRIEVPGRSQLCLLPSEVQLQRNLHLPLRDVSLALIHSVSFDKAARLSAVDEERCCRPLSNMFDVNNTQCASHHLLHGI